jgi:hypothetical protein
MSRKRGNSEISQAVSALVDAGGGVKSIRRYKPMTEATKAKLREYGRQKRAQNAVARAVGIQLATPTAQALWAADTRPAWAKLRDQSVAGPYARSIRSYNPRRNDWPGVDDLGLVGVGDPTAYKFRQRKGYVMTAKRAAAAANLRAAAEARIAERVASYSPERYAKYMRDKAKRDAKKMR